MFDTLHNAYAKTSLGRSPELSKSAAKRPILLSARVQRLAVVGPTVLFSFWLNSLGLPLWLRMPASIAVGAILILAIARHQRRARLY